MHNNAVSQTALLPCRSIPIPHIHTNLEDRWESFWALKTGSTVFPESRPAYAPIYPSHPLSVDLRLLVSKLPRRFQVLAQRQKLALDVLHVLSRTVEAEEDLKLYGALVERQEMFRSRKRRYQDFWEACPRFGAPDELNPYEEWEPNFEKLVLFALMLYCMHTFSPIHTISTVYNGARTSLTRNLPRRRKDLMVPAQQDCLLWVWMILVNSWRALDQKLLPTGTKLMQELCDTWKDAVRSWHELDTMLRKLCWNERFGRRCNGYWDSMRLDGHGSG